MTSLPHNFVYLEDIDSSIAQEIAYATDKNFVGRPLDGYSSKRCIIAQPLAEALSRVQLALAPQGYSLKVFDAYRPLRTLEDLCDWAKDPSDTVMKDRYYPTLEKSELFEKAYIKLRSSHSQGLAVDLTLIDSNAQELDMGTIFDQFDPKSHSDSTQINKVSAQNRQILKNAMALEGFVQYQYEWWHFTYIKAAPSDIYYDFIIQ